MGICLQLWCQIIHKFLFPYYFPNISPMISYHPMVNILDVQVPWMVTPSTSPAPAAWSPRNALRL